MYIHLRNLIVLVWMMYIHLRNLIVFCFVKTIYTLRRVFITSTCLEFLYSDDGFSLKVDKTIRTHQILNDTFILFA